MDEAGSIKIKITSDSDAVLKDLQKIEQRAKSAFDKAAASIRNTERQIAALDARMDALKADKAAQLDIGLKWDEGAFNAALTKSLEMDAAYRKMAQASERLEQRLANQKQYASELGAAHEKAAQDVLEHSNSEEKLSGAAEKSKQIFASLGTRLKTLKQNTGTATKETRKHTRAMKDNTRAADPLSKSLKRLANMLKLMLFNMLLWKGIEAVKQGFADLAKYSDSFQETMSRLATSFLFVRNAITAAFKPVLEGLAPLIENVADWFAKAANSAAQFSAALFGNGTTYTQATKAATQFGDATEKAAKKTDKAMASFDQINQLSFGKKEDAQAPSPDEMFQEAPIDKATQGIADKIKGLFEEWKGYAAEIGAVFKQSWTGQGQTTIDAVKTTLSGILSLIGQIGRSFASVWTNGTGLTVLNNIHLLLQTILGIIGAIAAAFTVAWATNNAGTQLIQAIADALNNIITLVVSIGQAFIIAWNEGGLGQTILGHLISIATGLITVVGNLAERFTVAWNAGGNGQAIMSAILQIINAVLKTVDDLVQATVEWASGLDLEPLLSSISNILMPISTIVSAIGTALSDIWKNIVLPFLGWVIETGLPALINSLAGILSFLAEHASALTTVTKLVVLFIAAWKISSVLPALFKLAQGIGRVASSLSGSLSPLTQWRLELMLVVAGIVLLVDLALKVANAWKDMSSLEKAVSVLGLLAIAAATVAVAVHALTGAGGAMMVAGAIAAGVAGAAAAIWAVNRATSRAQGTASSSGRSVPSSYSLKSAPIPRLATGAVIPPNNEFLAVLGDQKRGTNIEAPISTIEEAVGRAMDARGGSAGGEITIRIIADGKLARALKTEMDNESRRRGVKLVTGGAY
ncbi:hypothetical protein [Intestinibacillus massiliensis]|uniref:hypothetical protein n=1 Tax=Intestinibacillus massiliensis TaxID=1871029 RepID=UPI000B35A6DD|nr:hypothetical protein [Intestinibacillus massiliensis]